MSQPDSSDPSVCPVDHNTRTAWLEQAAKTKAAEAPTPSPSSLVSGNSCDSSKVERFSPTKPATLSSAIPLPSFLQGPKLNTEREVSSIPRALPPSQVVGVGQDVVKTTPANNQAETGKDEKTGNWIYPSERQFFDAMARKQHSPSPTDMRHIVPLHNAVNERAWSLILGWEKPYTSSCPLGPRLASFSGESSRLTPRARWKMLMGATRPFDRHDWVVERCGIKVEYVIDFYAGKDEGKFGKSVNFYLDVRPKLNSWEGVKMRFFRFLGMGGN